MKCELSYQAFKWHDGTQWHVGKMVMHGECKIHPHMCLVPYPVNGVLMCHSHTCDLEFVPHNQLSPYGPPGSDKMPEAGK